VGGAKGKQTGLGEALISKEAWQLELESDDSLACRMAQFTQNLARMEGDDWHDQTIFLVLQSKGTDSSFIWDSQSASSATCVSGWLLPWCQNHASGDVTRKAGTTLYRTIQDASQANSIPCPSWISCSIRGDFGRGVGAQPQSGRCSDLRGC